MPSDVHIITCITIHMLLVCEKLLLRLGGGWGGFPSQIPILKPADEEISHSPFSQITLYMFFLVTSLWSHCCN